MLSTEEKNAIIALIHQEVIPAIGCTEPMAVALCVAKATEILGRKPDFDGFSVFSVRNYGSLGLSPSG